MSFFGGNEIDLKGKIQIADKLLNLLTMELKGTSKCSETGKFRITSKPNSPKLAKNPKKKSIHTYMLQLYYESTKGAKNRWKWSKQFDTDALSK